MKDEGLKTKASPSAPLREKSRIERLELFPATLEEFSYPEWGEKKRMIGKQYFLENQDGTLGLYEIGKHTVPAELAQFITEGRCWVLRSESVMKEETRS